MTRLASSPRRRDGVATHRWTHRPANAVRARNALRTYLLGWGVSPEVADDAVLVLSELFTNAVSHARKPGGHVIGTRFERLVGGVRIEVHDASGVSPRRQEPTTYAEFGRGLVLVDALTGGSWGVGDREGVGKMVWAECVEAGSEVRG
ncbi:ATP-binding protein [Streptomyces sp. DT171]|uniref:ATP-binding protein n=1 Tax=Streptomyces sp. DT171 TaxID=3416524 RepID=UPI003CF2C2FF